MDENNNNNEFSEFKPYQEQQIPDEQGQVEQSQEIPPEEFHKPEEQEVQEVQAQETPQEEACQHDESQPQQQYQPPPENTYSYNSSSVSGDMEAEIKTLCAVCHICTAIAPWIIITGFVPLVMYFLRPDDDGKALRFHAKQSFIYFLAYFILFIILFIIGFVFSFVTLGCGTIIFVPLMLLYQVAGMIVPIIATVKIFQGENYRIPYCADWAENFGK